MCLGRPWSGRSRSARSRNQARVSSARTPPRCFTETVSLCRVPGDRVRHRILALDRRGCCPSSLESGLSSGSFRGRMVRHDSCCSARSSMRGGSPDPRPGRARANGSRSGWSRNATVTLLALVSVSNLLIPAVHTDPKPGCCSDPLCQCARCTGAGHHASCCSSQPTHHALPGLWHECHHRGPVATVSPGGSEAELPVRPLLVAATRSGSSRIDALTFPIARPPLVPDPVPRTLA